MDRRTLAALVGWLLAATYFAVAVRLVRELREEHEAAGADAIERCSAAVAGQPTGPDAEAWGMHLADEASQLVEHGFEAVAADLFAASGELLETVDRAPS